MAGRLSTNRRAGRSMPLVASSASQGARHRAADACDAGELTHCEHKTEYLCSQPRATQGWLRIQVRSSLFTEYLLMTTWVRLVLSCLRRLLALLLGVRPPASFEPVARAQAAGFPAASFPRTSAHPIHAPEPHLTC